MPLLSLPHGDFFGSIEPLGSVLETAAGTFPASPGLSTSLPSLMMWQDQFVHGLTKKGSLSMIVALYGKNVYCPVPPHPFTPENLRIAFDYMKEVNGRGPGVSRVEGLTEEQKGAVEGWGFPSRPTLTEYLYDRAGLSGLHGDPYRSKRAEVNHLAKNHSVVLRPFRKADLGPCGDLFELWKGQRSAASQGEMGGAMLRAAQKAHFRVLQEGEDWGMEAWVVLVDGRLAAYTAGAPLSPGTYGIFLEVSDLTIKGLSAYIFANVCRQLEAYPSINTGDAEGLPGLAESKEHWHPVHRLRLYAADPKN